MQSGSAQQGVKQVITDREARKAVARLVAVMDDEEHGKCPGEAARRVYQTTCQEIAEQRGVEDLRIAVRFLEQHFSRMERCGVK